MSANASKCTCEFRVQRIGKISGAFTVSQPAEVVTYWQSVVARAAWHDPEKEMLVALLLNVRYRCLGHALISVGTLNEAMAHPREVFRPAIAAGCYAMVLAHNHTSGDPSPSGPDLAMTKKISDGAALLEMRLLDHVIVGDAQISAPGYFSFREAGHL